VIDMTNEIFEFVVGLYWFGACLSRADVLLETNNHF